MQSPEVIKVRFCRGDIDIFQEQPLFGRHCKTILQWLHPTRVCFSSALLIYIWIFIIELLASFEMQIFNETLFVAGK